jgi:hypothetical protein
MALRLELKTNRSGLALIAFRTAPVGHAIGESLPQRIQLREVVLWDAAHRVPVRTGARTPTIANVVVTGCDRSRSLGVELVIEANFSTPIAATAFPAPTGGRGTWRPSVTRMGPALARVSAAEANR